MVERQVDIDGVLYRMDLNNPVKRYMNPILTADHINRVWRSPALQVKTVHNAGVAEFDDQTVLLFRSHLRSCRIAASLSTHGLAASLAVMCQARPLARCRRYPLR